MTLEEYDIAMNTVKGLRAYADAAEEESRLLEVETYRKARETIGEDSKDWPVDVHLLRGKLLDHEISKKG